MFDTLIFIVSAWKDSKKSVKLSHNIPAKPNASNPLILKKEKCNLYGNKHMVLMEHYAIIFLK